MALAAAFALGGCSGYSPGNSVPAFDAAPTPSSHASASTAPEDTPAPGSFDEFSGPAGSQPDPAHWVQQTGGGGWGNHELQTYAATNGVLDGKGHLAITATMGPGGTAPYTSARVTTHGKASFGYGTVSARIKFPDGGSLLPSFWMLGSDVDTVGWPQCGEIDVVEAPIDTHRTTHYVHGPEVGSPTANVQAGEVVMHEQPMSSAFHVYSVTRSPGHVVISVDGRVATDLTPESAPSNLQWVFDGPFDIVLSMAIGGSTPAPTASSATSATMLVDWVRYAPAS
ncbi:glycoside hydrolase family 16 protein [Curtobacterium sp. RRHDQ10]|uniref:glycoside hydrolase family 16 protein n=1 Tax=Curtobacterium phyllosphaerae TaxID=3413379 RepID=UPI003BF26DA3